MTLLNLGSRNVNTDDTTSVYGTQGNAVEVIGPVRVTVFADPLDTASEMPIPIWYAPATSDQYFQNLLNSPQDFVSVEDGIAVFKMYEIMASWPDATLQAFFGFLSAHNIKLGIDALPLVASPGQPGYGTEAFGAPGTLVDLVSRIQSLGGSLSYVAWDEPWLYGSATGLFSVSYVAQQVALASSEVKAIFPDAKIGDIEPAGSDPGEATALQQWFTAYDQVNGAPFDFLQLDVATWSYGWQNGLGAVIAMAHKNSIPVGLLVDGDGLANTNATWAAAADANAMLMLSNPALRPDYLVVQSWQNIPDETADPAVSGTLASVEADVAAGATASLAIPATAQYDSTGVLQNVTWQGGWSAIQDGTLLEFLSPTDAIVVKTQWIDVQVFAFDPATATLSLRVLVQNATAAGTMPTWQTESFSVGAGSSGFNFGVPALATSAVTMVLAPASYTGLPGSNFTDQALATLVGTAAPNGAVALELDGNSLGTVTANGSGAWTYTFTTAVADGVHVVQASATNPSTGTSVQQLYAFSVDAEPPAKSTLTLAPGSDSGYPGDDITDVTQPVLAGVAAPHEHIKLAIDGATVASIETDTNGNWSFGTNAPLALGAHTVTATATDLAGSVSSASTMHLVIDTPTAEAANTSPDPLFDTEWYVDTYPTSVVAGESAYTEFMSQGWKQGNDPDPFFDTSYYLSTYPDVAAAGFNPLTHFEQSGAAEGRDISATFNTHDYAAANPGIPAGEDPVTFYIQSLEYADVVYTAVSSTAVTVALLHDTGVSATDGLTSDPTLAITAAPGSTVTVAVNAGTPSVFTLGASGSWNYAYAPAHPADGKYTIAVSETELNGPTSNATQNFTLDTAAPTVTAAAGTPVGITLGAGSVVSVTLTFSEAVLVTGAPTLTLNDGGVAQYFAGSGSTALTFAYTVAAGQNTSALTVSAINLPGLATIDDAAGNAANLAGATAAWSNALAVAAPASGPGPVTTLGNGQMVTLSGTVDGASVALAGTLATGAAAIAVNNAAFGPGFAVRVAGAGSATRYGSLTANGTLTNHGVISATSGTTGGAASLAIALGGSASSPGVLDNLGTIDSEAGSTIDLTGGGINSLVNPGQLVANGMVFIGAPLSGTGQISIGTAAGAAGRLEVQASVASTQSILFNAGTLTIDQMSGFAATLKDFNPLDRIVLSALDVTSVSFLNGTLALNGGAAGSLHLTTANSAGFTTGSFVLAHSGAETIITTTLPA